MMAVESAGRRREHIRKRQPQFRGTGATAKLNTARAARAERSKSRPIRILRRGRGCCLLGNGSCLTHRVDVSVRDKSFGVRRALRDALLTVCAVGILLIALLAIDGRLREEIATNMTGARATTEQAAYEGQAHLGFWIHLVKNESQQHAPLLVMVVAGSMLALFMFRT
jgi:hypothetical protein